MLVGVYATSECSEVADQLEGWNGGQAGQDTILWVHLDEEVDFAQVDQSADVLESREDDSCGSALLHLKDIGHDLTAVLIVEDHEDNWRLCHIIDH